MLNFNLHICLCQNATLLLSMMTIELNKEVSGFNSTVSYEIVKIYIFALCVCILYIYIYIYIYMSVWKCVALQPKLSSILGLYVLSQYHTQLSFKLFHYCTIMDIFRRDFSTLMVSQIILRQIKWTWTCRSCTYSCFQIKVIIIV